MNGFEKLDKFHGEKGQVTLTNDDGNEQSFDIYQLPIKYLPKLLKLQSYQSKMVVKKEKTVRDPATRQMSKQIVEESDFSILSPEDAEACANLMMDLAITSIAYSYVDNKDNEAQIAEASKLVSNWGIAHLEKIMDVIMKVNNVESGKKKP